jgi:hypothetical protein
MENPTKPQRRVRDPNKFLQAPVAKPTSEKTRRLYEVRVAELAQQLPPRMVRYVSQRFRGRASSQEFIDRYNLGCCLTGRRFSDRHDPKNPKPDGCVVRPDGSMVTYAAHTLTQAGVIPDKLLVAAARAIVAHADRRPTAHPPPRTQPTTQTPPQEADYARTTLFSLEPGYPDDGQPGDTLGQPEPAGHGHVPVRWEWSDSANAVVATPI